MVETDFSFVLKRYRRRHFTWLHWLAILSPVVEWVYKSSTGYVHQVFELVISNFVIFSFFGVDIYHPYVYTIPKEHVPFCCLSAKKNGELTSWIQIFISKLPAILYTHKGLYQVACFQRYIRHINSNLRSLYALNHFKNSMLQNNKTTVMPFSKLG